ncbi:MAG TPA: N-acetylmuramoyl-L-alanine amidase [Acidobacteriota bacterium]|nr:N-acetylmuramoyl-L-alanine amidase [Acidobacteriota bacterium]
MAGPVNETPFFAGKWLKNAIKRISPRRGPRAHRLDILRDVYKANLLLLGKPVPGGREKYYRTFLPFRRGFSVAVVCLFVFIMYGHFFKGSFHMTAPLEKDAQMQKEPFAASGELPASTKNSDIFSAAIDSTMRGESGHDYFSDDLIAGETAHEPRYGANIAELKSLRTDGDIPLRHMLGLGIKRITIDPGHGGSETGAVGKMGTMEKDLTLDIARRLKDRLIRSGFLHIHMTREYDVDIPLEARVESAHAAKADLFVSIHVNWLPNTTVNVIETFYFGPSRDRRILDLAERENMGSQYGLSEFQELLKKLGSKMKLQESRELAESIQESLYSNMSRHNAGIRDNGVKRAPFVVLLGPDVPSVLVEVSCLSNAQEERKLNTELHRENIAGYIADGIINYLNSGDSENDLAR